MSKTAQQGDVVERIEQTVQTGETLKQPDKHEILGNTKLLRDTTYLLFGLPDLKREIVMNELHRFFADRINNRNNDEWDAKIVPIRNEHEEKYKKWREEELAQQHKRMEAEGLLAQDHLPQLQLIWQ